MQSTDKQACVIVGIGEMGGVFARGLLRLGHPVYPVTRNTDMRALARQLPQPRMVLAAVGENALQDLLADIPGPWQTRLALLQNELLPADYASLQQPTVISVWFEKKKGQDVKVLVPSPVFGPNAGLLIEALDCIGIAAREVTTAQRMQFELVVKNLYIVTTNIAGLRVGGNVDDLWQEHRELAQAVAGDVIDIQEALTDSRYDRDALVAAMLQAFEGDPAHMCMGRSAPARLRRAIEHADRLGLRVPVLRDIAQSQPDA